MKERFRRVAARTSILVGSANVFALALCAVFIWLITGPFFGFSDTWQLIINTGTTIVTFLMVFLIQNTQNRDGKAIQLKLDELIRAHKGARMRYVGLEEFSDAELADIEAEIRAIANHPASKRAMAKLHERLAHETQQRESSKNQARNTSMHPIAAPGSQTHRTAATSTSPAPSSRDAATPTTPTSLSPRRSTSSQLSIQQSTPTPRTRPTLEKLSRPQTTSTPSNTSTSRQTNHTRTTIHAQPLAHRSVKQQALTTTAHAVAPLRGTTMRRRVSG